MKIRRHGDCGQHRNIVRQLHGKRRRQPLGRNRADAVAAFERRGKIVCMDAAVGAAAPGNPAGGAEQLARRVGQNLLHGAGVRLKLPAAEVGAEEFEPEQ